MEQEYILNDVDDIPTDTVQEYIHYPTSNVEMNHQQLLIIEPKIEPIDSENQDSNAQSDTESELQQDNFNYDLPVALNLRFSEQTKQKYVVYDVPENNFVHPITAMSVSSAVTTQGSIPRLPPTACQLNTTATIGQPKLKVEVRPNNLNAEIMITTPAIVMPAAAPRPITQKMPTLLLPSNGTATMPSYMKPIRFHKPLHFNLSDQRYEGENSVQYGLHEPMAKQPRVETTSEARPMPPLKSLSTQQLQLEQNVIKVNQRKEYSYFAQYIVCQLEQLPREIAVELEMQIHDLIGQKRLSLMREGDRNVDSGSTIVIN